MVGRPPTDGTVMIVTLQPYHDAVVMKVMATWQAADVDQTTVFLQTNGTLEARDHSGRMGRGLIRIPSNAIRNKRFGRRRLGLGARKARTGRVFVVPSVKLPDRKVFQVVGRYNRCEPKVGQGQSFN